MADLNFRCFHCNEVSAMVLTAEGRDEVYRFRDDPALVHEKTFYCERCGAANTIELTAEMLMALLGRISSDDPQIQRAIDDAKKGNYDSAIDQARKRFGF